MYHKKKYKFNPIFKINYKDIYTRSIFKSDFTVILLLAENKICSQNVILRRATPIID